MTRKTAFFFDELSLWHSAGPHALTLPVGGWVQPPAAAGHAESPETKRRLKSLLDVSGLTRQLQVRGATAASEEDLLRVHSAEYLQRFRALSEAGGGELGPQAPIGPGSYEIARLSAGLAMAAVDAVLGGEADNAYSLSRPPGHHCLADGAMGFCFLANIAIAIEAAKARRGLGKVAVIDWDVHHGNGTQSIFEERGDVLTISLHQDGCFPPGYSGEQDRGRGAGLGGQSQYPAAARQRPRCLPACPATHRDSGPGALPAGADHRCLRLRRQRGRPAGADAAAQRLVPRHDPPGARSRRASVPGPAGAGA
ncbi:histone deacetylase superfamily protein [Pseudomonas chlororaphis subsp. aurantiaca]|nr:histone deacetylase superfamily protein [Pseudomonas chlororaphis subsp. aurantiaca]